MALSQSVSVAAAALAVVVLAGCGGSGHGDAGGMGRGGMMGNGGGGMPMGSQPGSIPAATTGAASAGQGEALFVSTGCGGCHTLAAAGTTGTAGPNLDQAHVAYERIVRQVSDGGGGMPGFAGSLTTSQIRAIARYVADSAR